MIDIRTAIKADAAMLARLRYDFRTRNLPGDEDRHAFLERCEAWMRERLGLQANWHCWIAEDNGAAVGNIWLNLIEKIPNPAPETEFHAYITNFYVLEDARGQGVGSRLLDAALRWCRERRVHAVILWPSDRSRPLYERNGFAVRDDLLELILHPVSPGK
jgi:GNAT superfamily N-acetyltransferase